MSEKLEPSLLDRNADSLRLSRRRQRPRLSIGGASNGQDESGDSEEDILARHHPRSVIEADSSSEVDHGEEVVEFEVSEDDLTDLFSCPHIHSIKLGEDEREEANSMPDEIYAWDAVKSQYKTASYDILQSYFSISEEGKLGKIPVPDLFTAGKLQLEPKSSLDVFKWLSEREQLKRLLIEVYSSYDSGSQDCRYMNPGVEASCKAQTDGPLSSKCMAWFCLPYLRSGKCTTNTGAGNLSKHPPWGLLQWHYNDHDNRRNLDLDQTICRFTKSSDNAVQIDQLWCITINQGLIMTSARCSAETLIGSNSSLSSADLEVMAGHSDKFSRGLLVHDSGNRVWSFDLGECSTWLGFVAQFRTITESFDDNYAVFEDKTIIRSQDWVDVYSRAMHSLVHLTVVKSSRETIQRSENAIRLNRAAPIVQKLESSIDIPAHLDQMAESNPALLAYTKGDEGAKQSKINSLLRTEVLMEKFQAEANSSQSKAHKALTELKCSILSSARVIAGFFLPPSDKSLLSQRYWSVIIAPLEATYDQSTVDLESLSNHLKRLSKTVTSYQKLLHPALTPSPMDLELPVELGLVWVLLLKALITAGKIHYSSYQVADTFRECNSLLKCARRKMLLQLSPKDLAHAEIVLPMGLSGIIMNTLVEDIRSSSQDDLVSTYLQYSDALELDILKSRGDREYHAQFTRVSHELSVMRDIAASQIKVLEDLQKAYGTGAGGSAAKAIGVHGPETGLESRLLYRARRTAQAKYKQWTALMKEFDDLKTENERMVTMKKDNRETASIIFAIVSTIFLPLTAVASVLGMSTSDIRDMRQGQWIFWVTGLPLAVVTGFLCVAAVDRHLISTTFSWMGGHFAQGDERLRRRLSRRLSETEESEERTAMPKLARSSRRRGAVDVELGV
ncbi:Mg2+ transporter [Venturia nashicola]|nr:Mg2+ transporter [Venturia nashicola]